MRFFQKIRLPLAGILAVTSICIMIMSYNWYFTDRFKAELQEMLIQASGMAVEVGAIDLNLFSGTGNIQFVGFNDKGAEFKNLLELEDLELSFSVVSVYWGPLVIERLVSPPNSINGYIVDSGARLKGFSNRWRTPANDKPAGKARAFIIQNVSLGKGQMKFGEILVGAEVENVIEFPETRLTFSQAQNEALSDVGQIRQILAEAADQSLQATGYSVLK